MATNNTNRGISEDTKTIITVLLLIFVFPIGVIMMWVWMKWSKWVKILVTLVIALPFLAIIFLAALTVTLVNPVELTRTARDVARLKDANNLQITINEVIENKSTKSGCSDVAPCEGRSNSTDPNNKNMDGTGWVKVSLTGAKNSPVATLPIDPLNTDQYFYRYCSNGQDWEIDIPLESQKYTKVNGNMYKIGSKPGICK